MPIRALGSLALLAAAVLMEVAVLAMVVRGRRRLPRLAHPILTWILFALAFGVVPGIETILLVAVLYFGIPVVGVVFWLVAVVFPLAIGLLFGLYMEQRLRVVNDDPRRE